MKIQELLQNKILFLDGGMGTLLQAEGLIPGEYPEKWNISHPETIRKIHTDYYNAGSNIVSANTFGANRLKFNSDELEEIIATAIGHVKAAQLASKGAQEKFVALDVGPLGKLLKPYGDLEFEEAVSIFSETIRYGAKHGADLIFIETMNDSYETKAALLAAKENCDLPVFVSNAYGEDGKLMTGASPAAMVAMLEGMGADCIGVNCSLGPDALMPVVEAYLKYASIPVLVKPNAGLPQSIDQKTVYTLKAPDFAKQVAKMLEMGVSAAGGCCGTTPEYIENLTKIARNIPHRPIQTKNIAWVSSYTHAVIFDQEPILIGERINPTGKKRFKQALVEKDMDYILKEGIRQQECGAAILDVNVGLPEINEKELLLQTIQELQAICDLPLQIDTADSKALEAGLRAYNGKAMINSVSGKEESMAAVFPLARKYGGLVVALTLDEGGIPATAEGRLAIARKILTRAKEYGLGEKDLIFDPLCMAISADDSAAIETLKSIKLIKEELGCHTSLGVSNVSFGLPCRDAVNSVFFTSALECGMNAAIMNPYSLEMMKSYYCWRALHGFDTSCLDYIAFSQKIPSSAEASSSKPIESKPEDLSSELQNAIEKGLKDAAYAKTKEMIKDKPPLSIVEEEIIPALNAVGEGFEKKVIYLPQLLMSAEAAKAAFEVIKDAAQQEEKQSIKRATIILATVEGDIHDIGKNIVKLLLENFGFEVVDLGKDVAPEKILEAAITNHAPLVGLSALMTTTVPAMEETIRLLRENAPKCKVMVGGAVLNPEYAQKIGADFYGKDAMEAVRYAEQL